MNALKKDLQSVVKELKRLTQKAEKIETSLEKASKAKAPKKSRPKPAAKAAKRKVASTGKKMSASETIFSIIKKSRSKKGVDSDMLEKMTGFNNQKIRDNIYKLNKRGKIKRMGRGFYVAT